MLGGGWRGRFLWLIEWVVEGCFFFSFFVFWERVGGRLGEFIMGGLGVMVFLFAVEGWVDCGGVERW